jgi:5-hydroxyisourate hydrolase-like protein (transthyretin family)
MRKYFFAVSFLMLSVCLVAQKTIQSTVFDANNGMPLEMVTVRLLKAADSTLVQGAQTNSNGWFSLQRINPGKYVLIVSSVGYNEHKEPVTMERRDIMLKNIQLQENVQALKDLEVRGTAAQLVVKGDTIEYNATAFKVQENAVVEDLLKRLPGVEVTSDGKITVNGQEIKKIRVDGKKFFDGDMEMATKNLPAEMIEKVQVLEQKSEMAQLTGFEDDETERIINLTTKTNRRKGVFGNVVGGAGLDTENLIRYDGNANINFMDGDSQTSLVAGANNVNTTRSRRGRGSWGANNGITETQNFGLNNNAIVNERFKIGGDGSFNHSNNFSETNSTKESYLRESVFNDSTYSTSVNDRYEANLRLEAEWKPDSLTTIIMQPNINYNSGTSSSYRDYIYLQDLDTTSYGDASNAGLNNSLSVGLRLIVSRKFPSKPGRTLTANVYSGFSQSENQNYNFSNKVSTNQTTLINQYTLNTSDRFNFNTRVSFVEPLWNNKNMLEAVLAFSSTTQNSIKDQYASLDTASFYNMNPDDYTIYVEDYSNSFKNRFFRETLELNYRFTEKDYNLTLGLKAEPSQTYSQTLYKNGDTRDVENEVINFAPNGRFQYNFGKKEFLRVDYRGYTRQPSINQMQPVKNNEDLMRETVGNPTLNPSFSNYMRLMYSNFNDKTFSSFSTWLSANYVKDELVINRLYDNSGKQYTQTVNTTQSPVSFNGNIMFNTPIIQKRLHFNTSTNIGYNTNYGYTKKNLDVNIDSLIENANLPLGDLSFTRRYSFQEQLSLTFTHEKIELGGRGIFRYSNSLNNLSDRLTETYDWTLRGNVVLRLPYDITLNSDINYSNRMGYSNFDQSELLWNASVDKSLFNNRGVLSLKWYDILRQQLNIRQVVGDNSISFTKYNTLTSYFIVSFSYRIRQFGGRSGDDQDSRSRDGRFGPGMRPEGGGGGSHRTGGGRPMNF